MGFWAVTAFVVGTGLYLVWIYNALVSLRERAEAAWADIDVQLKRRHDLIPNLVESVKGYMHYEQETLQKVIEARRQSEHAATLQQKAEAESMLSSALSHLFALSESYPDLKANENFLHLQGELASIEDALQNARRYYNAVVRDYNAKIDSFPDMIIAKKFGFTPKEYFELTDETQKRVPKIDFS